MVKVSRPIAKWARDQTVGSQLGGYLPLQGLVFRCWAGDRYRLGHQPVRSQRAVRPGVVSQEVEHLAAALGSMYSQATVR